MATGTAHLMERLCLFAFVSISWCVSPLVQRRVVDYMRVEQVDTRDLNPARVFVALYSTAQAIIAVLLACPAPFYQYWSRLPAAGCTLLGVGAFMSSCASLALVELLRTGNPGLTMVCLTASTSIVGYVIGALLYDHLTFDNTAGVFIIAAGLCLAAL